MDTDKTPQAPQGPRSLPRRVQIGHLVRAAVAIVLVFCAIALLRAVFRPRETLPLAQEPGTFQPSKEQAAGFKIAPVALMAFHNEQITDGKVAANDNTTTPVFSPFSGRVTRLIAQAGDIVQKGQPLFAIDASEFAQGQSDLVSAAAALRTADAQLKLAAENEKRQHEVYEAKGSALKDWLQSQSDLVNAEDNQRSAEIALNAVRNRLRILGKSDAEIAALETSHGTARTNSETIVSAPIGGTIIQRQVSVGQYINSAANGATGPVYQIGDLSSVWLIANVREVAAPAMHVGDPVEVTVLAFPDRVFKARLAYVGAVVDDTTRRVSVRAEIENPDRALKPEMFASFRIVTSPDSTAPAVPESAVVYEGETAHVWVSRDDGRIALRPIRAGRTLNGMVEVLDGLKQGEKIVTSGTLFIDRAAEGA